MLPSQSYYLPSRDAVVQWKPSKAIRHWDYIIGCIGVAFAGAILAISAINLATGCDRDNREGCFVIDAFWGGRDAR